MTEEAYRLEILLLEDAVKALLIIVSGYMTTNNLTDDWGSPIDFSKEMGAVRDTLRKTETFKSNWK